jgi:hypothetical protein
MSDGYSKSIRQCRRAAGMDCGFREIGIVRCDTRERASARDEYSPAKRLLMLPGAFEAFRYELMDSCAAEAPRRELTFRFDKPAQIPRTGGGGEAASCESSARRRPTPLLGAVGNEAARLERVI